MCFFLFQTEYLVQWRGKPDVKDCTWERRHVVAEQEMKLAAFYQRSHNKDDSPEPQPELKKKKKKKCLRKLKPKKKKKKKEVKVLPIVDLTNDVSASESSGSRQIPPTPSIRSDRSTTPSTATMESDVIMLPDGPMPIPIALSDDSPYSEWNLKRIVHFFRDFDEATKYIIQLADDTLRFIPSRDGNQLWPQAVFAFHESRV